MIKKMILASVLLVTSLGLRLLAEQEDNPALEDDSTVLVDDSIVLEDTDGFYSKYIADRLSVGLGVTRFRLSDGDLTPSDGSTKSFLGAIRKLNEKQSSIPRIVVQYLLNDYLKLEFTHDEVAARAQNIDLNGTPGPVDGTIKMSGPIFSLLAQYPIKNRLYPYAGIGFAPWRAQFKYTPSPWWHLGWADPEDYEQYGSKGEYRNHKRRDMVVKGDSAPVLTAGLAVKVTKDIELDFMVRHIRLVSDGEFYTTLGSRTYLTREGEFPMTHTAYGASLKYVF